MSWPSNADYTDAVEDLRYAVADEELRAGQIATNALGMPLTWAGNFAVVFKIHCPESGNTWALKCFTREVANLRQRYQAIAKHLKREILPCMVDFEFLAEGVRVDGHWFPALKMRWVNGQQLHEFLRSNLRRRPVLRRFLEVWETLARRLSASQLAHGDLQHGNVLAVEINDQQYMRLVDYDGMCVPELVGWQCNETGHPAYQHPRRSCKSAYNLQIDRFSHLVIYTSVYCLTAKATKDEARKLWNDNREGLLFSENDFQRPDRSQVFRRLWQLDDDGAKALVGRLALACIRPIQSVPELTEIVDGGQIRPLGNEDYAMAKQLLEGSGSLWWMQPVSWDRPFTNSTSPLTSSAGQSTAQQTGPNEYKWLTFSPEEMDSQKEQRSDDFELSEEIVIYPAYPREKQEDIELYTGEVVIVDPEDVELYKADPGLDRWYLCTVGGAPYGPMTRAELDQWASKGLITAQCQVLCEGWPQWQPAANIYPQLAQSLLLQQAQPQEQQAVLQQTENESENAWMAPSLMGAVIGGIIGASNGGIGSTIAGGILGAMVGAIAWGLGGWWAFGLAVLITLRLLTKR